MRKRAIWITPYPPLPLVNGGAIRTYNLMRGLVRRGWEFDLFSLFTHRTSPEVERELRTLCRGVTLRPRAISRITRLRRFAWQTATRRSYLETYWVNSSAHTLRQALADTPPPDVIIFSHVHMYRYVPPNLRHIAIVDTQNAEASRLARVAAARPRSVRGLASRLHIGPTRRFEQTVLSTIQCALAVSREDYAYFESLVPGRTAIVPNGVDIRLLQFRTQTPKKPTVLFMGSMWYHANIDAVGYLVGTIFPRMSTSGCQFTIVGANPTREVYAIAARSPIPTTVTGYVPDTTPYLEESRVLAVPLRYGGGTRIKILEAMARGVPVVSTSAGAEGLDLTPGVHLLIADDPVDFAACLDRLLSDDALCARLAAAARDAVAQRFDWDVIAEGLDRVLMKAAGAPSRSEVRP